MYFLVPGVILTALSWVIAWSEAGVFTEYSFLPLWLGYILTINGISQTVYRTSLLSVMGWHFLVLFGASIPMWWFFESVNQLVQNWEYKLPHPISEMHYVLQASSNFATVIPAVLSTAYLVYQIFPNRSFHGPRWKVRTQYLQMAVAVGFLSFLGLRVFPHETFPLVWIAPILFLEPLAYVSGLPSMLRVLSEGNYRLPCSVMSGTLFTGIWWELWNYYSLPKWVYHIPYVGFWKVFEMPILGYLGYPFFGFVVFTWGAIVLWVCFGQSLADIFDATPRPKHRSGEFAE